MPQTDIHLVDLKKRVSSWGTSLFQLADQLRENKSSPPGPGPLVNKTAALVFHKPSLRTRVSFTVGMQELGGNIVELGSAEVSAGGRESLKDVAHVLSEMCSLLVIRTYAHKTVEDLAEHASIPVINALTDFMHPCQVLSDLYTIYRAGKDLDNITVAWVGDANNVLHSWLEATNMFGFHLRFAVPDGFEPDAELYLRTTEHARGEVTRFHDPYDAVQGADVIYTDTWTSMGQEDQADWRRQVFSGYQVNDALMAAARPDAVFMHCLPAHRGQEVSDAVLDGAQSIVVEQAANRLHLQKALMVDLVSAQENIQKVEASAELTGKPAEPLAKATLQV